MRHRLWQPKASCRVTHQFLVFCAHAASAMSAVIVQEFFQRKQAIFANEKPELPIAPRLFVAGAEKRLLHDAQIEAAIGVKASNGVPPKASLCNKLRTNNASAIHYRVIAATLIVDIKGWWQLLHFVIEDREKIPAHSLRVLPVPCKPNCAGVSGGL
jgi:hypothetical protein